MNNYVTGSAIKSLRELRRLTQAELGEKIGVSSKTVSKWETARGLPDLTRLQPLSQALGVSVMELMNGEHIVNHNVSCNLLRAKLYVCPICGNVIYSTGVAPIHCCGVALPALEAEEMDDAHKLQITPVEDEDFLSCGHPMTKTHFLSFAAFVTSDGFQLVKFYPEGNAESLMQIRGHGVLYLYCIGHGLFRKKI